MNISGIIYKVTNKINGKCYIGQTVQKLYRRKSSHIHSSKNGSKTYFHNAIRKYGSENFIFEEITSCDSSILNAMEEFFVTVYKNHNKVYNMTDGGNSCPVKNGHTEEAKRKIGEKNKGRKHTEEAKRKMSLAQKGSHKKPFSESHRKKLSELAKNRSEEHKQKIKENRNIKGERNPMYGRHHSEESRKKMSEMAKERWKKKNEINI